MTGSVRLVTKGAMYPVNANQFAVAFFMAQVRVERESERVEGEAGDPSAGEASRFIARLSVVCLFSNRSVGYSLKISWRSKYSVADSSSSSFASWI